MPHNNNRTPDSGVFSSSSSFGCATSNSGNSDLKFCYEPQSSNVLAGTGTTNDVNMSATFKDSPPSSPGSEAGSMKKRGRKPANKIQQQQQLERQQQQQQQQSSAVSISLDGNNDFKDVKIFQNGSGNNTMATGAAATIMPQSALHMLGNQLNPHSSAAQKLSDQLNMEIQDHSVYTPDALTAPYVGVPFPGKLRSAASSATTPTSSTASATTAGNAGATTSLASMFGSSMNGNLAIPQSLEQLLERQWEQGSQFLMEQAQHFDIASLLSCLHQLQSENVRLEEHVTSLIARRDHLLAVNARLAIPLNANTTTAQSQASTTVSATTAAAAAAAAATLATAVTSATTSNARLLPATTPNARNNSMAIIPTSTQLQQISALAVMENGGIDFRQNPATSAAIAAVVTATNVATQSSSATPLSLRLN